MQLCRIHVIIGLNDADSTQSLKCSLSRNPNRPNFNVLLRLKVVSAILSKAHSWGLTTQSQSSVCEILWSLKGACVPCTYQSPKQYIHCILYSDQSEWVSCFFARRGNEVCLQEETNWLTSSQQERHKRWQKFNKKMINTRVHRWVHRKEKGIWPQLWKMKNSYWGGILPFISSVEVGGVCDFLLMRIEWYRGHIQSLIQALMFWKCSLEILSRGIRMG